MNRKRKIKKSAFIKLFIVLLVFVIGILYIIKTINYHNSYEYKLKQLNYSDTEIKNIKKLKNSTIDYILTIDYNKNISKFIDQKYFLESNLKSYLKYAKENVKSKKEIVSIVNVGADHDFYKNDKISDVSLGNLLLVNKFYHLDNTYSPELKNISNQYSYGDNQKITVDTYNAFIQMFKAAKKEDLTLIINSSYRSYEEQEEVYNEYKSSRGEEGADLIAARPGYSEHQTGMAIDIQTFGSTGKTFEEFDEFKWLQENAYKYGFILRYPKDKEYLTGYNYESWHYRYVGVDVATYIHENNITFDEYYAYFIEGGKNEKK